jgi:hypothetical protein
LEMGEIWVSGRSMTVAQTEFAPKVISPPGPGIPAWIVAIARRVLESTRVMLPSPWFRVQMEPTPDVRKRGLGPTGIDGATSFVFASTGVRALDLFPVIQTVPSL